MSIVKEKASILTQTEIARDIFDMTISFPEGAKMAVPGQFMSLYCNEAVSYTHLTLPTTERV